MTERCDQLHAYVDSELDDAETVGFEAHLATCEACLAELPRLLALLEALDGAARVARAAAPAAPAEPRPAGLTVIPGGRSARPDRAGTPAPVPAARPARRRTWAWAGGLAVAAAAVVALLVVPPRPPGSDAVAIGEVLGPTRPFEVRLSAPGADRHRPMNVARGAGPGPAPEQTARLGKLELQLAEARNWRGQAAVALFAGERERAARVLAGAPVTPEVESDRAAVELIDGQPAAVVRALDHVDRALAAAPDLPIALWNRGLVLTALDLPIAAAGEFDRVAARGESGWADEARERAAALRGRFKARRLLWQRVITAERTVLDDPPRVPPDAYQVPGFTTVVLYDAVRAAPSAEAALALLPLARPLDAVHRNDQLVRYIQRIAASDFRIRKPLADTYRRLVLGPALDPPAIDSFLQQAERTHQDDLVMGALVLLGRVQDRLEDYRRLAAASGDPWLLAIAEQETAAAEIARGRYAAAERRLRQAIATAQTEHLVYRALVLRGRLVELYQAEHLLTRASDEARIVYREAIAAGEAVREMDALADLSAIDQNRYANGLARAYLTEQLERTESNDAIGPSPLATMTCATREYAYQSLANLALDALQPDRARELLARAPACKQDTHPDMLVRRALFAAELYRQGRRDGDAEVARASLAALRGRSLTPGQQAMADLIEGDLALDTDRDTSRRHLRDAIDRAGRDPDLRSVKARAYGYSLLAIGAGRAGQFSDVLDLLAEALEVSRPARCTVAIARFGERSAVAIADAHGATAGRYAGSSKSPEIDAAALVPADLVERLRGCDRVAVLARAPVLGLGRLLSPDIAWSYLVAGPAPAPARPRSAEPPESSRLVIANPETLPDLKLPPLAPYPAAPEPGSTVLRGADATPSRVLVAMRDASVIEFHTHGLLGNDVSESSYLVLSPELDRQYALTARDVAGIDLVGRPLVILGACHAADSSRSPESGVGLPEAFLRSGARAVIASPEAIEDLGAGPFFTAVRERVMRGVDPAVAVRDERLHRLAVSRDDTWVSGVVVFESPGTASM
jgi:tetratricopeptide (TPR) repeat protein